MPINWHERSFSCMQLSLGNYTEQLARMQERCDALKKQLEFYQKQIDSAKAAGKDGFDPDRYLIPKEKPKANENISTPDA